MSMNAGATPDSSRRPVGLETDGAGQLDQVELEIDEYPATNGAEPEKNPVDEEVESLVQAARESSMASPPSQKTPIGYVSNARNASSTSDSFDFWAPAEETGIGIGSLIRHTGRDSGGQQTINTYAVVTGTEGRTLGLDDYAVHVYEQDARPPLESIAPAPSRRRPIVNYHAQVLTSSQLIQRPVTSGPVYPVDATEMAQIHGQDASQWPGTEYVLLGLYEDAVGAFGILAEDLARVLGPKQGHIIVSGQPGAGKTSLFLTFVIALYSQLGVQNKENGNEQ